MCCVETKRVGFIITYIIAHRQYVSWFYDMAKLWRGALADNSGLSVGAIRPAGWMFEEIQKYNRYVFFIAKPEVSIVSTSVGSGVPTSLGAGRINNPNGFKEGQVLAIENRLCIKLGLPEKMGRWQEGNYQNSDIISENHQRDVFFSQYQKYTQVEATGSIWQNTQTAGVVSFTETQ